MLRNKRKQKLTSASMNVWTKIELECWVERERLDKLQTSQGYNIFLFTKVFLVLWLELSILLYQLIYDTLSQGLYIETTMQILNETLFELQTKMIK